MAAVWNQEAMGWGMKSKRWGEVGDKSIGLTGQSKNFEFCNSIRSNGKVEGNGVI